MSVHIPPSRLKADLGLVFVALCWGATFVLVKAALHDVSTLLFLTIRFLLAAVVLALIFRRSWIPRRKADLLAGVTIGFVLFSGYVLQTFGLQYTTAAKAGFLTGMYIPLVPIFAAIVYRRLPQRVEIVGVIVAGAGLILLTLPQGSFSISFGDLLVLACAVPYAIHILLLGHFAKRVNYTTLSVSQIAAAGLFGATAFWWAETPRIHWSGPVITALLVTSLLATAAAFSIQTWAQQYTTPTRTALIFSLEPVFAWVAAYLLVGEVLSLRAAIGAVLIFSGIVLVEWK